MLLFVIFKIYFIDNETNLSWEGEDCGNHYLYFYGVRAPVIGNNV